MSRWIVNLFPKRKPLHHRDAGIKVRFAFICETEIKQGLFVHRPTPTHSEHGTVGIFLREVIESKRLMRERESVPEGETVGQQFGDSLCRARIGTSRTTQWNGFSTNPFQFGFLSCFQEFTRCFAFMKGQ